MSDDQPAPPADDQPAPPEPSRVQEDMRRWRRSMLHLMMAIVFVGGFMAGILTYAVRVPPAFYPLVVMGCVGATWLVTWRGSR